MNCQTVTATYNRLAAVYDFIFQPFLQPGRRRVIQSLSLNGSRRVLEVGVGTGIYLKHYPPRCRVTGIDVSPKMLDLARKRVRKHGLRHVELLLMDAENMRLEENGFDAVVALHVVNVTPNPEALMREIRRVCKPGGDIFIVNHFSSRNKKNSRLEQSLSPLQTIIGWKPCFNYEKFVRGNNINVHDLRRVNLMGCWTFIHAKNT